MSASLRLTPHGGGAEPTPLGEPFPLEIWADGPAPDSIPLLRQKVRDFTSGGWSLKGAGEVGPGCGVVGHARCMSCGHEESFTHECLRRDCPNCGEAWVANESINAARRIMAARVGQKGTPWGRHAVVSPRWELERLPTPGEVRKLRREAGRLARRKGFRGGTVVYHPWRDSEVQGVYDVVGPHFHILGWADKLRPGGEDQDGDVVFVGVESRDGRAYRLMNGEEFEKALRYELGHAGIHEGIHALTYFGICSYNVLSWEKVDSLISPRESGRKCPVCGGEMRAFSEGFSWYEREDWASWGPPCRSA